MTIERHFLGLDRPALSSATDWLITRFAVEGTLDLGRLIVVTPGGRAGRRLAERLYVAARAARLVYFPPTLMTVGQLPEMLYQPQRPFASEWCQRLAWSQSAASASPATRAQLAPRNSDTIMSYTVADWFSLGDLLRRCYRELAAEGLSFADVVERSVDLTNFPESPRWAAMARIQSDYLRRLDEVQLWDRQTARLEAVRRGECRTDRHICLVATADLGGNLRSMLDQLEWGGDAASAILALIHAPTAWSDRFDEHGCIIAEKWRTAEIPLQDDQIVIADGYGDQAAWVVKILTAVEAQFACDEISIGCPDEKLIPYLQRALASEGIHGRWGPGKTLRETGPYRLLESLQRVLRTRDFSAHATFLRHPDVDDWLVRKGCAPWIPQLDRYQSLHLPTEFPTHWLGSDADCDRLVAVSQHLRGLIDPFTAGKRELGDWAHRVIQFLATIYDGADWSSDPTGVRVTTESAAVLHEALRALTEIPAELSQAWSAPEMLEQLLESCGATAVAELPDPDAIELLGWLELPLDDAPYMVITGVHEGSLPPSGRGDMFLPNALRRHLKIEDDDDRYCRDVYALSVLAGSRPDVPLIAGSRTAVGDPLQPSRLLFAADADTVTRRWLRRFDPAQRSASPPIGLPRASADSTHASCGKFGFVVPKPVHVTNLMDTLRTTDFKTYMACPYRFYLSRVLRLQTMPDEFYEMDGAAFGSLIHDIMNDFGLSSKKDSTDEREIQRELVAHLDRHLQRQFGTAWTPAVRIQREQIRLRLQAFAIRQAERRACGWRIEYVEQPATVVASIRVAAGEMKLAGRIDRIDIHERTGEYSILDYKTSDAGDIPEKTHRKLKQEWIDLQLPLYRYLARAMGLGEIASVGYVLMSKQLTSIGFSFADWSDGDYHSAEEQARQVVQNVLDQKFWPPKDPQFDDYPSILLQGVRERPVWS